MNPGVKEVTYRWVCSGPHAHTLGPMECEETFTVNGGIVPQPHPPLGWLFLTQGSLTRAFCSEVCLRRNLAELEVAK